MLEDMIAGTISSRYAKALLSLVGESGRGDQVCAQVRAILADPDSRPASLEPDLERFVAFVLKKGRRAYLKLILHSFVDQYHSAHRIKVAHLTTVVPSPELEDRIRALFDGYRLIFERKTDSSLIGGFVLTVDGLMMDASVESQLRLIRRQFLKKKRRIV